MVVKNVMRGQRGAKKNHRAKARNVVRKAANITRNTEIAEARSQRSDREQIALLETRPGKSLKETNKLLRRIVEGLEAESNLELSC